MFELDFTTFNTLEGLFWIALSVGVYVVQNRLPKITPHFWIITSVNFLLFGLSDFVEVYTQTSFLTPGYEWLLVWKVLCIALFSFLLTQYLYFRSRS